MSGAFLETHDTNGRVEPYASEVAFTGSVSPNTAATSWSEARS